MSSKTIRVLIIMATISIIGIVGTQIYWVKQAFNQEQEEFHRDVNRSLNEVANELFSLTGSSSPSANPIKQISGNYYVVMINDQIDANILEILLKQSFQKRNLKADFEYSIYDCGTECMVYGDYVSMTSKPAAKASIELPVWNETDYYFGVYFPAHASYLINGMGIWIFSSLVLVVVILLFSYSMFVILKQKRLSEIQKDFINNMTHEFKTPISTIEIATGVLKEATIINQPERLKNYTAIIETENQRLQKQVDRVLQIANLENVKTELKKEPLDMHQILFDVVNQVKSGGNSISMELNAIGHKIMADSVHMTNIIYNLLDNAIKYTNDSGEIKVTTTNNSHNDFVMTFEDNGIGISKQEQNEIFSKFYRVPTGNIHNVKGFGIGLYYVQTLIKAHGGQITLESELGKGSSFKLVLPI